MSQPETLALLKEDAPKSMAYMLVTWDVSQVSMFPLKEIASLNMYIISVTCEVFHLDMSPLKESFLAKAVYFPPLKPIILRT